MRIVFMGTPDFAAASLKKLIDEKRDVVGVFTQPDKPKGRGMELAASPVKVLALENGIPVYQPVKMRDGTALEMIKALEPDILVVVAYGRILPDDILAVPEYGAINVHGSLLPKYRGAAPIQWSVLNGDKITGVTTMYLAHDMDAGDVIYKAETEIGEYETAGELFDRLMDMGAELLIKTLDDIESGTAPRTPQDHSQATYVGMLDKSICPIDWNNTPRMVLKHIYGLQPWPVATMELDGTVYRVFGAEYTNNKCSAEPGMVVGADKNGIEIACADGETLLITELQAPGKKLFSSAASRLRASITAVLMISMPSRSAPAEMSFSFFSCISQERMFPFPCILIAAAKDFPPGAEHASSTVIPCSGAAISAAVRAARSCT